jgi:hypothetical protein
MVFRAKVSSPAARRDFRAGELPPRGGSGVGSLLGTEGARKQKCPRFAGLEKCTNRDGLPTRPITVVAQNLLRSPQTGAVLVYDPARPHILPVGHRLR